MIRTSAPRRLFDVAFGPAGDKRVEMFDVECDTGMVQLDSLNVDERESLRLARTFHEHLREKTISEAAFLKEHRIDLVAGDIPPLAFAAAAGAGIPSVALGNFTWDWIYEEYAERSDSSWIQLLRDAYQHATLALRLPMAGGFAGLEKVTRDIPLVARKAQANPDEVRQWLDVPRAKRLVLMSFGAYGIGGLDTRRLADLREYAVVTTDLPTRGPGIRPAGGLIYLAEQRLYQRGYRYEDLVRAADVVVTKPGYGIISECIENSTAILYTSRGRFREYDVLVREMPKYLRTQFIPQEDLLAGNWRGALEELLSSPAPPEKPATNGAQVAAEFIFALSP